MEALAHKLLDQYYGIKGKLKQLNAYASLNYLVTAKGKKYVFKIYEDTKEAELIEAENQVLLTLSHKNAGLNLPTPIEAIDGQFVIHHKEGKKRHILRLLSYVEGKPWAENKVNAKLLTSLGKYLASLDHSLLKVSNPVFQSRIYHWNIQQLHLAEEKAQYITDIRDRNLVKHFILQYRENVAPQVHQLRHAIIHNDVHEWNILARNNKVTSVIDFGDTVYAPLVQEIAIAMTYIMMASNDPIATALPLLKSYHKQLPLKEHEVELLYYFIAARLSVSVCMSAYSKSLRPDDEYVTISEQPAWNLLRKLVATNPLHLTKAFKKACGFKLKKQKRKDLVTSRHQVISKALSLSYSSPIAMTGAAFQYMYDNTGKAYLDCANNIFHVGYNHPVLTHAAQRQMARLNTNTRYLYEELNHYAEDLLKKFDERLNKVFFVNSGSAATDLALRLARNYTGNQRTMVMDHGYHGNTAAGIEVSAYKFNGKGGAGKAPHIVIAPLPDEDNKIEVLDNLKTDLDGDEPIGTFIAESIVGCGGQVPLSPSYVQGLYQMIRLQGGICIADEVQTGFGRVGSHFWAFETQELNPDIVILGKPMGNGHPLAAVVTTQEIAQAFENGMEFFSSFGGNPVSCVIGQAVLDIIHEENLQAHALTTGNYLMAQLNSLKGLHACISDVRGHGLFLGIELSDRGAPAAKLTKSVVDQLKNDGVLLGIDGPHHNVIKFKPPMCFDQANADLLVSKLDRALKKARY